MTSSQEALNTRARENPGGLDIPIDEDRCLNQSLELFDFSVPLRKKQKNVLRLFYNNCNGMEINNMVEDVIRRQRDKIKHNYLTDMENPTKLDGILRQMLSWEVDVVALAETCVDWNQIVPRRTIQHITKGYDRTACWTGASSSVNIGNYLKPGGTGTLALGKCNGRILDKGVDPWQMGRWSYILIGTDTSSPSLLVITGYRTGDRSGKAGVKTVWAQQEAILLKQKRAISPSQSFFLDLENWIREYKSETMELLICMDANDRWIRGSSIITFANTMNLLNVNEELQLEPTHPNIAKMEKSTTIDFCLCSQKVLRSIVYGGSAPYEMEVLGDHRGFILDIQLNLLFHSEDIQNNQQRKLVLSNPKAVDKYLELVMELFTRQNIFERSRKLLYRVNNGHTDLDEIMKAYESLDREVYGICKKAEKKCKPEWAGRYEWSPKLACEIKTLNYWRHRLKHKEHTIVQQRAEKELNMKYVTLTDCTIHQMINDSKGRLRAIQQESRKYRQEHLEELAQNYANQNNLSVNRSILELMSHERARETFSSLRRSLKDTGKTQLSSLWISLDENGNYTKDAHDKRVLTTKEEVHRALLQRNEEHLRQAAGTPFARGWLKTGLKWDGTGRLSTAMLNGDLLNEKRFREAMQLYLECIKVNDLTKLNKVTSNILLEEYQSFWKKKRESTVTSPYGLHIGHYKAAVHQLKILEVHRILLVIPFKTGRVPSRWRRTVQTMIEKEPGAPWIHRLRIIELFDAQANAGFQIFVGRKMMRHAVHNNLLSEESFGSTPGKMATSALVQKMIAIDQLRIERRAGGIFDCDASGCYDRILPPLASVHLQALGMQQSIGTFLARLMYLSKRHVKTIHGTSRKNIRTTKRKVLYGIGQGNGGGPAMWISHLTVMFAALSSVCLGVVMTCVEGIRKIATVGTGYVDDVTLGLSLQKKQRQTEKQVLIQIQRMSQLWETLLYITGGRLELSKCFWVPITWKWYNGKVTLVQKKSKGEVLYLRESETKEMIEIPRKLGSDVEKRLGVYHSCDGKWTYELNRWKKLSQEFGDKLKHAQIDRLGGYLAYHALWVAKFRYSAA